MFSIFYVVMQIRYKSSCKIPPQFFRDVYDTYFSNSDGGDISRVARRGSRVHVRQLTVVLHGEKEAYPISSPHQISQPDLSTSNK